MRRAYKRILILCEGHTEERYAKALKNELSRKAQRNLEVDIVNNSHTNPLSLAEAAKSRGVKASKEGNAYDEIWLFFDHDNEHNLQSAFQIIRKQKFRIAYSSICIEHWFILHFEDCGRSFLTANEAKARLMKVWPSYRKTKLNHFEHLKEKLPEAMRRAERIRKQALEDVPIEEQNPYITIDELIDAFRKLDS